jgi:hypothetical protein
MTPIAALDTGSDADLVTHWATYRARPARGRPPAAMTTYARLYQGTGHPGAGGDFSSDDSDADVAAPSEATVGHTAVNAVTLKPSNGVRGTMVVGVTGSGGGLGDVGGVGIGVVQTLKPPPPPAPQNPAPQKRKNQPGGIMGLPRKHHSAAAAAPKELLSTGGVKYIPSVRRQRPAPLPPAPPPPPLPSTAASESGDGLMCRTVPSRSHDSINRLGAGAYTRSQFSST